MISNNFAQALERIFSATGARTQTALAEVLEIKQSSVADAKRRSVLPANWLVILLEKYQLNPMWVKTGFGAKYLVPAKDV